MMRHTFRVFGRAVPAALAILLCATPTLASAEAVGGRYEAYLECMDRAVKVEKLPAARAELRCQHILDSTDARTYARPTGAPDTSSRDLGAVFQQSQAGGGLPALRNPYQRYLSCVQEMVATGLEQAAADEICGRKHLDDELPNQRARQLLPKPTQDPSGKQNLDEAPLFPNVTQLLGNLGFYAPNHQYIAGRAVTWSTGAMMGAVLLHRLFDFLAAAPQARPAMVLRALIPIPRQPAAKLDLPAMGLTLQEARAFFASGSAQQRTSCQRGGRYLKLCEFLQTLDYELAVQTGRTL